MKIKLLQLFLTLLLFASFSLFSIDPLPSWNEGETKNAILDFVKAVTDKDSKNFVEEKNRIATFDQDGTLWVEQPIYAQSFFIFDTIKSMAKDHPNWKEEGPFKYILDDNLEALKNLSSQEIQEIIAVSHAHMSLEEFQEKVAEWLKTAQHPRYHKSFTDLVYQPMIEVMEFLKKNQFKIYIVSGGGQEFIRTYAEKVYGLTPEYIIGTASKMKYEYKGGKPILYRLPDLLFVDNYKGKPISINLIIGKKPIASFGNSDGDREMLEWTDSYLKKTLKVLIHHDDEIREYSYGPHSKVGTFSEALMNEALQKKWSIVSMKNDWKIIFK